MFLSNFSFSRLTLPDSSAYPRGRITQTPGLGPNDRNVELPVHSRAHFHVMIQESGVHRSTLNSQLANLLTNYGVTNLLIIMY